MNALTKEEEQARVWQFKDEPALPLAPADVDRLSEEWQSRRLVVPAKNFKE